MALLLLKVKRKRFPLDELAPNATPKVLKFNNLVDTIQEENDKQYWTVLKNLLARRWLQIICRNYNNITLIKRGNNRLQVKQQPLVS